MVGAIVRRGSELPPLRRGRKDLREFESEGDRLGRAAIVGAEIEITVPRVSKGTGRQVEEIRGGGI